MSDIKIDTVFRWNIMNSLLGTQKVVSFFKKLVYVHTWRWVCDVFKFLPNSIL